MSEGDPQKPKRALRELALRRESVSLKSALGWMFLSAAAYLGNALHVPLFVNVDFLFGSIFTLIVLHYYGWIPALITSLVAGSFTAVLWLHPYAGIILIAETLVIGLFYRRRSQNLMLLATVFWIPVGMPLVLLFYSYVLGLGIDETTIIMLKQAINGIFNALIASLVISLARSLCPSFEPPESRSPFAFAQVIFLSVVAFVLIPAMVVLVVSARSEMGRVEQEIQARLTLTSEAARQGVSAWVRENLQTLGSIAGYARPDDPEQMVQLREELALLRMSDEDFKVISVIDQSGTLVAAEPHEAAEHALSGIDVAKWPYFVRMVNGRHGVASNAVQRPSAEAPMVMLGVPIVHGDSFAGAVVGVVNVDRLQDVLARLIGSWHVTASIVDGNGLALATTSSELGHFDQVYAHLPRPQEHLHGNLFVRFPAGDQNRSAVSRWPDTEFMTLDRMQANTDWLLFLDAPTAPYQDALTGQYQGTLFWMMIIILAITGLAAVTSKAMLSSLTRLTVVAEDLPNKVTAQRELEWPSSRIGEIDALINCFRVTSDHLGTSFRQIQETNARLMDATEQAEAASRAKSQFLANVSHDLRTPLNGILGYAQILSHDSTLDDRTQEAIRIIEQSGNHLLNLINDILDISRIESQKLELEEHPFSLQRFLDDLSDIVRLQVRRRGLRFETDFDPALPLAVEGDEKRTRQVLLNLLTNAVKFTNEGGVTLRVRWQEGLHVQIVDTGRGIPVEQQSEIFTPFRQLDKHVQAEEGSGLGLAIVDRLVKAMAGTITLESSIGVGSTFTVWLPLAVSEKEPLAPRVPSRITGYEGARITVLIVDDKWENRSVVRSMLVPLGFEVIEAENGSEGVQAITDHAPDIVFMDLVMPVLDGFGAIKTLRAQENAVPPVVALSASVANSIRQECVRVGFSDFLPKPFEEHQLLELIHGHSRVRWTYDNDPGTTQVESEAVLTAPQQEQLAELIHHVSAGHIREIIAAVDRLSRDRPEYDPFARYVRRLAGEFRINQLAEYLAGLQSDGESESTDG